MIPDSFPEPPLVALEPCAERADGAGQKVELHCASDHSNTQVSFPLGELGARDCAVSADADRARAPGRPRGIGENFGVEEEVKIVRRGAPGVVRRSRRLVIRESVTRGRGLVRRAGSSKPLTRQSRMTRHSLVHGEVGRSFLISRSTRYVVRVVWSLINWDWRGSGLWITGRSELSDGRGNAPLDHHDLQGVVHDQARDHGIGENREHLRPGQRRKSRKTHARLDVARERIRHEGGREGLASTTVVDHPFSLPKPREKRPSSTVR